MQTPPQLVDAYRAASYAVRLTDGSRQILHIGKRVPNALCSWIGNDWPMVFLSASNPSSNVLALIENRRRTRGLLAYLKQLPHRKLIGVGRARDKSWRETSLLICGLSLQAADRLAIEFGQNAIVISMDPESTGLRVYRNEWRGQVDSDAHIIWCEP